MTSSNSKKREQLGMSYGTASGRLRKLVLFDLLVRYGEAVCFQCGEQIKSAEELSIEHKEPWLDTDDPVANFFSLDNIAFSHLSCNSRAARRPSAHPNEAARAAAERKSWRDGKRKRYTTEARREKFARTGH